mmetsp:Transcript_4287/g.10143  ORF Transcript_4287/g.10143 Transcript_4287/m.10143 type:complete len:220 (-) Transcript_4287:3912-4571(-)
MPMPSQRIWTMNKNQMLSQMQPQTKHRPLPRTKQTWAQRKVLIPLLGPLLQHVPQAARPAGLPRGHRQSLTTQQQQQPPTEEVRASAAEAPGSAPAISRMPPQRQLQKPLLVMVGPGGNASICLHVSAMAPGCMQRFAALLEHHMKPGSLPVALPVFMHQRLQLLAEFLDLALGCAVALRPPNNLGAAVRKHHSSHGRRDHPRLIPQASLLLRKQCLQT